jgi:hypothetical protein
MDRESIKIAMITAVSKAFNYKEQLNNSIDENGAEIYQKVVPELVHRDKRVKIAMIAAISNAIKFMQANPESEEKEVLQHVSTESDAILSAIGL